MNGGTWVVLSRIMRIMGCQELVSIPDRCLPAYFPRFLIFTIFEKCITFLVIIATWPIRKSLVSNEEQVSNDL